jgi:hypothetical protein
MIDIDTLLLVDLKADSDLEYLAHHGTSSLRSGDF